MKLLETVVIVPNYNEKYIFLNICINLHVTKFLFMTVDEICEHITFSLEIFGNFLHSASLKYPRDLI
jgi:hypothetical protein